MRRRHQGKRRFGTERPARGSDGGVQRTGDEESMILLEPGNRGLAKVRVEGECHATGKETARSSIDVWS